MSVRAATYADYLVGKRIRLARKTLKMSQRDFATSLGVTYQQIQKYEQGHDRISAGKLYIIAQLTDKPVSFFFQSIDDEEQILEHDEFHIDLLKDRKIEKIAAAAARIKDRRRILALTRIAQSFENAELSI